MILTLTRSYIPGTSNDPREERGMIYVIEIEPQHVRDFLKELSGHEHLPMGKDIDQMYDTLEADQLEKGFWYQTFFDYMQGQLDEGKL